jgi:hypothetical protein
MNLESKMQRDDRRKYLPFGFRCLRAAIVTDALFAGLARLGFDGRADHWGFILLNQTAIIAVALLMPAFFYIALTNRSVVRMQAAGLFAVCVLIFGSLPPLN